MKIFIKGKGELSLDKRDYLASGGEGDIYSKGGMAYKIYQDPNKMIAISKIQELSAITDPHIIKPEDVICDSKGHSIGYSMKLVKDNYSLCQIFTKSFKERNGVSHQMSFEIVKKLGDLVKHVHQKNILIVDLNEFNFLTSKDFKEVMAIDTDSYQTLNHPATAIMETIRDRHSKVFNTGTDWFSFSLVAFQLLIGIHPYKGTHPQVKDFDERMVKNLSVLNPIVSIPKVCYPFSVIPPNWLTYFKAVFENGIRDVPPIDGNVYNIAAIARQIFGSNNFVLTHIGDFNGNITNYETNNGNRLLFTTTSMSTSMYLNEKEVTSLKTKKGELGFTPKMCHPFLVSKTVEGLTCITNCYTKLETILDVNCSDIMSYDGRVYIKNGQHVLEVKCLEMGTNTIFSTKKVGTVMENASQTFPGCIIQNMLGMYVVSLFPKENHSYQVNLKELEGHKIIEAKYSNKILMVIASKKGKYHRFIFKIDGETFDNYSLGKIDDITPVGLNFVVLDNGVCAVINEDEKLELFSNNKNSTDVKVIDDPNISGDMKLFKDGNTVLFSRANKLFKIKMK